MVQGEPLLPPAQHGTGTGRAGKQRITWGQQYPGSSLVFRPPLLSRARQAAETGKKEHATVCVCLLVLAPLSSIDRNLKHDV